MQDRGILLTFCNKFYECFDTRVNRNVVDIESRKWHLYTTNMGFSVQTELLKGERKVIYNLI